MQVKIAGVGTFDSEFTPMAICLSEEEKVEIASVVGRPDLDVYNRYPLGMSEAAFQIAMEATA